MAPERLNLTAPRKYSKVTSTVFHKVTTPQQDKFIYLTRRTLKKIQTIESIHRLRPRETTQKVARYMHIAEVPMLANDSRKDIRNQHVGTTVPFSTNWETNLPERL